ncbi:MAG: DUF4872 domain-containing protein [Spirochaetaceae bacterium]|nr:DUF4872 domain-containing protein [Spirochaetaceae bacterium]
MKYVVFINLFSLFLIGCTDKTVLRESAILENVQPLPGKHCESSAIVNALNYQGYHIDEILLTGAGAAPSYIYDKGPFPFLGGRSLNMREVAFSNLGINWSVRTPGNKDSHWDEILELLKNDTPVVLRVDMRYLPYLWDGKYGSKYTSFGWHMITLFGINHENNVAYVTDTEMSGLQEIKLEDLTKARGSNTKTFPPENEYFWIEKAPENFSFDLEEVVFHSIDQYIDNMNSGINPLTGLKGISQLPSEIENIETYVKSYMLAPVFEFMSGSIETNGTGGGFFRKFYSDFLFRASRELDKEDLETAAELALDCAQSWTDLSKEFKSLSADIFSIKDKEKRKERYSQAIVISQQIFNKEQLFLTHLMSIRR